MRKEIPKIIQTFSEVISDNMLYADKTEYIYNIIKKFKVCFLCRPRRFGKSLLLSTIQSLFSGERELFKGLWIDSSDYTFQKHPVIRLSMDYSKTSEPGMLEKQILLDLHDLGKDEGISITDLTIDAALKQLVKGLYENYNNLQSTASIDHDRQEPVRKVVILIDEYDAPIIDNLDNSMMAENNHKILHDFYRGFKNLDNIIRFVFVTGISQAARASLGQTSNNIDDISLMPEYAGICGFTLQDLDSLFADRYEETLNVLITKKKMQPDATVADLRKQLLHWYDGYVFDGETPFDETTSDKPIRVLNPYSIVNFFKVQSFKDYWLKAGPPSFLTKLIANDPDSFIFKTPLIVPEENLSTFNPVDDSPIPILFQSGYLTLSGNSPENEDEPYTLKIPNKEVARGYPRAFYQAYFGYENINNLLSKGKIFKTAVLNHNTAELEKLFETALAKLSSEQHIPTEKYYHSVIQAFIGGMGIDARSQVSSSMGKSDLDLVFSNKVYVIIEVKFEKEPKKTSTMTTEDKREKARSLAKIALEQITKKEYSNHYALQAKKIVEIGLGIFGRSKVGVLLKDGKTAR
ncbi:MAG: ATP-binding protein [Deltaproteobacteria bacterium]|nr:ATP-binding protein [Deltaproteobacteria bacterium]